MLIKKTDKRRTLLFFAIAFYSLFFTSFAAATEEELGTVRSGVWNNGARWVPGETTVSRLPQEQRVKRLGLVKSAPKLWQNQLQSVSSPSLVSGTVLESVTSPAALDYRNYSGPNYVTGANYVTPIRDQGNCGGCWAFASTAALESQELLSSSSSTDEAEQILVSCSGAGNCNGGYIDSASDYIQGTGLPSETFFPYTGTNNSCSNALSNWRNVTYNILSWHWVSTTSPTVSAIKNALSVYGPLVTTMNVYSDFFYYTGGVYSHSSGTLQGGHAILIVGYDDTYQCFIVKNSWGTGWGESGFFRIAYNQLSSAVQFGFYTIAYSGASQPGGSVSVAISPSGAVSAGAKWNVDGGAWQASGATISGLTAGSHTINFNNISSWTSPSSQTVSVSDGVKTTAAGTYVQQAGSLSATIAPQGAVNSGAQWRVDAGAWQNSGATVSALPVGNHSVSFAGISGWNTPAAQTVAISNGQTTSASGTYAQQTGSLTVTVTPAGAITAGAQWQVDGGAWQNSGTTLSGLSVGQHTVNFSGISNWNTPAAQTVTISNGQTTSASGTYAQQTGSLNVTITPAGAITAGALWRVDGGVWHASGATVSALPLGQHNIDFSTVANWNTPASQTVAVSYGQTTTASGTYVLETGSLTVTISPQVAITAGAQWKVDSGTWQNSGATVSALPAGSHTVSFAGIAGWTTPAAQTVTISNGQTTTASATYVLQSGSLTVAITPAGAITAGAQWRVDGGTWQNSGATVSALTVGQHNVDFSTVANWNTPAAKPVAIVFAQKTAAAGTYVLQPPAVSSLQVSGSVGSTQSGTVSTSSRTITLANMVTGNPTSYIASESSAFSGAIWKPYSAAPAFTLSAGNGTKIVYFKVRNAAGASGAVSVPILLAQLPTVSSFRINAGTASTINPNVTLNNTARISPTQFMASEAADFTGAVWQPYTAAPGFTLSAGGGTKTVYFKVQNSAGESNAMVDSILLYTPPTVTSFQINGGAASTSSRTVTLNNTADGPPVYYMASNSSSFAGISWHPYSTAPSFTLSPGSGTKIVYLRVKNAAGASAAMSAPITLN